jgi:hypothetical protein
VELPLKEIKMLYLSQSINPIDFWSEAISRVLTTESERIYFSDHSLYSNQIYTRLEEGMKKVFLPPLSVYVIGQVLKYLDYKTIMTEVRYLNKSFLWLTQQNLQYVEGLDRSAILAATLNSVYDGSTKMPIVHHPYYTQCEKLKIIYQLSGGEEKTVKFRHKKLRRFMEDLFTRVDLFQNLKDLQIYFSHSQS